MHASNWKEAATAEVGGRSWVFTRSGRELTGRWAADPEGSTRLSARQTSFWKGTWAVDLEGMPVEMTNVSIWKGSHRYTAAGRQIATCTPTGWLRRPTLEAGPELGLDQQVFLLWVELVLGRRATAAAAA